MSGLREAGRIADYFLGFPNAYPEEPKHEPKQEETTPTDTGNNEVAATNVAVTAAGTSNEAVN